MDEPGSDDDGVVLNDTYRMRRTVEKVDIWRAEVESSTICCSCSEPTNSEPRTVPILHSILHSTSSAAAGSVNPPGSSQQSTTPFNPSTSVALQLGGPSGGPPACRLCGLPIDEDVALVRFRERGDQALLRSGASPRSEPSILHTGGVRSWRHYKKPGAGRFKRAIDDPLRPLKRLQNAVSAIDEKSAGKRILRPIKRLFRGSRQSLSSDDGPKPRPRATEMYRAYRADAVPGEGSGAGSVETLDGLSDDDDRGRPRLTIDDSAARLRRAQRLLEKANSPR
ncbi:hypothetical protein GGR54DRAFT_281632 [Hypoxylon sp. NC1633]|nr:hypothetical protein GGR54DRAFT_281632 [Hypoxylon sp. NC1633]